MKNANCKFQNVEEAWLTQMREEADDPSKSVNVIFRLRANRVAQSDTRGGASPVQAALLDEPAVAPGEERKLRAPHGRRDLRKVYAIATRRRAAADRQIDRGSGIATTAAILRLKLASGPNSQT
jgi:hypothetical protein